MHNIYYLVPNKFRENLAKQKNKGTWREDKDYPLCLQQHCACRRRGRKFTSVLEEMDNASLLGHNMKIYKIKSTEPIVS